jgi:hypothetical protein
MYFSSARQAGHIAAAFMPGKNVPELIKFHAMKPDFLPLSFYPRGPT